MLDKETLMAKSSFIVLVLGLISVPAQLTKSSLRPSEKRNQDCALIGFPDAKLNECGYCIGPQSGLDEDYGKDCLGVCGGSAKLDCRAVCNGDSFTDECSGQCIDQISDLTKLENRDCRGECIQVELTPEQFAYSLDGCGVCHLQSNEPSRFLDCTGKCHLPGTKPAKVMCNKCIPNPFGSSNGSQSPVDELLDDCGNCIADNIFCSCEKDPNSCGCQDDQNCYKLRSFSPVALPAKMESKVSLTGYFYPPTSDIQCIFQHQNSGATFSGTAVFTRGNRTTIHCNVNLLHEGAYIIGLRIGSAGQESFEAEPLIIYAYDKGKVRFTTMAPSEMLTTDSRKEITLTFNGPTFSLLPNLPLRCILVYDEKHEKEMIASGKEENTCVFPMASIANHRKSQTLFVTPTLDGVNPVSHPFTFTIIAPHPAISPQTCFISSDGLAVIIMFERPVDVSLNDMQIHGFSLCSFLLTPETLNRLTDYRLKECVWSSKVQFTAYLEKPIKENTLEISFKAGLIREDGQAIALWNEKEISVVIRKLTTEWWSYAPKLIITGPSEIPGCGSFALSGHYSSPSGSFDVTFKWTVTKDGNGRISEELSQLVSVINSQNLVLDASLFEVEQYYQFTLRAITEIEGVTLSATHKLIKFDYHAPIVSLYSTVMMPPTPLTVDQRALFWAEGYVPSCVFPFQRVGITWKVINPRIRFNFTLVHSPIYVLEPYSVPVNQEVTFYLSAFLGHRLNQTSGAALSILAGEAPLKAVICEDSPMIAIGENSGPFRLTGSNSGTGAGTHEKLIYHWSCIDSDSHQPCYYNFGKGTFGRDDERSPLLLNITQQRQQDLDLDSRMLEPNKELVFGLQVFDINNRSRTSETELTLLKVVGKDAPQIFMGPVYIKGKHKAKFRSPHNLAIIVPSHTQLIIKARIIPAFDVKSVEWEAVNFIHQPHWQNRIQANNEMLSELYLHGDYIFPYGFHAIKLRVCNKNNACSEAASQFTASEGVTQCQLLIGSYVQHELVTASVERCNIPPGYAPLVYQLYAMDSGDNTMFPVTTPQYSNVFFFHGIPPRDGENQISFMVRICDSFDYCQMTVPQSVDVVSNQNDKIQDLLDLARRYSTAGDPFNALSVLGAVMRAKISSYHRSKALEASVDYAVEVIQRPSQLMSRGHAALSFHILSKYLNDIKDNLLKRKAMDAVHKLIEKSMGLETLPDLMTIENTGNNILRTFGRRREEEERVNGEEDIDLEVLMSARATYEMLLQVTAAQAPLGKRVEFGKRVASDGSKKLVEAASLVVHDTNVNDINLSLKLEDGKVLRVKVDVGKDLKKLFSPPWRCQQATYCTSVVYSLTIFAHFGLYPSLKDAHRITPVIEFSVYAPNTGEKQKVKGLGKSAVISFTLMEPETTGDGTDGVGYETRCYFWDEKSQSWKTDGVHLYRVANGEISCWAGHLTGFTVFRARSSFRVANIIAIVIFILMGIVVLAVLIVLCSASKKRPQSESMRNSSQSLVRTPRTQFS